MVNGNESLGAGGQGPPAHLLTIPQQPQHNRFLHTLVHTTRSEATSSEATSTGGWMTISRPTGLAPSPWVPPPSPSTSPLHPFSPLSLLTCLPVGSITD
jgi:hypothetical protein